MSPPLPIAPWTEESKSQQWYGDETRDFPPHFTIDAMALMRRATGDGT